MALWSSVGFQDILSSTSSLLESLHDVIMVWLLVVLTLVIFISLSVFTKSKSHLRSDSLMLEIVWTLIPVMILLLVAFPSLQLLCAQDSVSRSPLMTLKVISSQWSWQSESEETFDHLLDSDPLDLSSSFDVPLILLSGLETRFLTVSTDVLHSLGIPSLAVKLDTAPGRISTTLVESLAPGVVMGSCYELCGSGHSAMPFSVLMV